MVIQSTQKLIRQMDCHQQKQFDLDLARLNMLTYETATNRVCQQHQRSLRTEVPRCPHVGGLKYFCNKIDKDTDPDVFQFVQMHKALPSSVKPNRDSWDPTALILDIQRERRCEGKRLTRFIMNTLGEVWSESHTPCRITLDYFSSDLIRYIPWYLDFETWSE